MKFIKITVVLIAISSVVLLAFAPDDLYSNATVANFNPVQIEKKWTLSHYEILGERFDPEPNEKNDYIHFHSNKKYTSVSEGKYEEGNYQLNHSRIIMTNSKEAGELILIIKELSDQQLMVIIDDPTDSDTKYLNIYFKNL